MVGITIATIFVLVGGGGDVDHFLTDLKKDVKTNVADKNRQKLILGEGKALSKNLKSLGKEINGHFKEYVAVNVDFRATETEFETAINQLITDQKESAKLILDARDAMHEQMTKEEWEAVFKSQD